MSKKAVFYIIFFTVLFIGFIVSFSFIQPGFLEPKFRPLGTVSPFSFQNQDGETVTENHIRNKVVAVEYFFTTCKGICPKMNANLKTVYEEFRQEPDFLILSHTSDPGTDSAARLKAYADSLKVDTKKWVFLTGRKDSLYSMARHSYKVDDPANNLTTIEDDFLHTQFVALVNRKGQVVQVFDALKPTEMREMEKKIRELLKS